MSLESTIAEAEARNQQTALREVLGLQPSTVTKAELIQALGADMADPLSVEPWQIAIRELCRCGLLQVEGQRVFPSLAASTFFEFLDTWA